MSLRQRLSLAASMFPFIFRDRRKAEELAVDIAMAHPGLDRSWVGAIVKRAYDVATRGPHSGLYLMSQLHDFAFSGRLRVGTEALRDPERAIPEEWA